MPGRLPGSRQVLGHVLRNARHVIAAGSYPAAEGEHAAGRRCRSRSSHRASTSSASVPLDDEPRRAARPASACRSTPSCRRRQPAGAPQGLRRHDPRRGCCADPPRPPAGDLRRGRDGRRLRLLAATRARRCGSSDGSPTTTCRRSTPAATCTPCCAATGGVGRAGGFRHRVPRGRGLWRPAGGRRLRRRGRRRRRRRDGYRRAPPRRPDEVAAAFADCSTIRRGARRWVSRRATGPSPSSPTTCSPIASAGRSGRSHDRRARLPGRGGRRYDSSAPRCSPSSSASPSRCATSASDRCSSLPCRWRCSPPAPPRRCGPTPRHWSARGPRRSASPTCTC